MQRREFVGGLLALTSARVLGVDAGDVDAPRFGTINFGYAAITWGGKDRVAIDDISSLGFRGIQLRASAVTEWSARPAELIQLLAARNLTFVALSSGSVSLLPNREASDLALHTRNAQFARDTGCRYLQVTDERPTGRAPTPDDYRRMGRLLTEIGKRTTDVGLTLGYHPHMGALGQSPDDVARIMDASDARYVKMELDIAHYQAAGGDPVDAVRRYADRMLFLHIKDLQTPIPGGAADSYRFVELGRGVVDVRAVLSTLNATQFNGWAIVELDDVPDKSRTPRECAAISKQFLESNGYPI